MEIGGRIPAVIGYVTEHTNSLKSPDVFTEKDLINFSTNWRDCFHTYSDLYARRLKRDMRSYFWQLYIKMVARICSDVSLEIDDVNNILYIPTLNKKLYFLTKFFSFSGISFRLGIKELEMDVNMVIFSINYILILEDEYSSFPSALGRIIGKGKFIDHYEVVSRINTELYYERYIPTENNIKHN